MITNLSWSLVTLLISFLDTLSAGDLPGDGVTGVVGHGDADRDVHILGHLDGHLLTHLLCDHLALGCPLAVPPVGGLSPQSTCQLEKY